ncbi:MULTISPECIES: hypothetical protein [Neobacillus]|uniref:Replicative helicase inhibitor G39P N-terminal domain-containing protein n=1 Tax=Neobacillus citreus TaxID=2833578 RepID=A0A942SUK2_9BACI|nr:hypothetical protein [Neobacillus citreus]MCH6265513.1 hypothetical protein [Neobacillus citreus]
MTKQEAFNLIVLIERVYPLFVAKNETVQQWFSVCAELDYKSVLGSIYEHIRISPYPPAINDIISEKWKSNNWMNEYHLKLS